MCGEVIGVNCPALSVLPALRLSVFYLINSSLSIWESEYMALCYSLIFCCWKTDLKVCPGGLQNKIFADNLKNLTEIIICTFKLIVFNWRKTTLENILPKYHLLLGLRRWLAPEVSNLPQPSPHFCSLPSARHLYPQHTFHLFIQTTA